jgi:hypothetical protein
MSFRERRHCTVNEVMAAAKFMGHIEEITVTGGEPTTHPLFCRIVDALRTELPRVELRLETNAVNYPKWSKDVLKVFSTITVTRYSSSSWYGCPDNSDKVALLCEDFPNVRILQAKHLDVSANRGERPCGREDRAHYSDGMVYGCCIGPGIDGGIGVPVDKDWPQRVLETKLPCANCMFGAP